MQGENEIPEKLKQNMKRIKEMHEDIKWQYMFWDSDKITEMMRAEGWIESYSKFIYLHQKVDFAKLVILYTYGGIFIDMDAYTHQPLDRLFDRYSNEDFVVSKVKTVNWITNYTVCGDGDFCINNGVYMGKAGADILLYLISVISKKTECGEYESRMSCIRNTTGPLTFDGLIKKYLKHGRVFSSRSIRKSRVTILPYDVMEPCIYDECDISDDTYVVHKHENTWISDSTQWMMRSYVAYQNMINLIVIMMMIVIIIILFHMYKKQ
jgi:mannosyltransferase OCH1-like enzyme